MFKQWKLVGGLILLALLALPGVGRALAAQATDPVQVATALAAAQNANDPAGMRALMSPDATVVNDPITGGGVDNRETFIAGNTGANLVQVTPSNVRQTASDTVTADAVLSGPDIPTQLAHPFMVNVTFTVENGLVTHMVIKISPQTVQDLGAAGLLPAPGMPTTGEPSGWFLPGVLALVALGLALAGLASRKFGLAR